MSDSWKLTLPCTRQEAAALGDDLGPFSLMETPPTVVTSEIDEAHPDAWRVDAYFEGKPDAEEIDAFQKLIPSAINATPELAKLEDEDWVTLSQQGLEPISEGRFFVHTPQHRDDVPESAIALEIDASRAFGTGQHATTAGCLAMLDRLGRDGATFENICDLGTGTGLLAFAAMALWPDALSIASDIDPLAIDIARENMAINNIPEGSGCGQLELAVAAGMEHERLQAIAPYDLVIANILARPLIELQPSITAAMQPAGTLILAGLQHHQADRVIAAYEDAAFDLTLRLDRGDWAILMLQKRP